MDAFLSQSPLEFGSSLEALDIRDNHVTVYITTLCCGNLEILYLDICGVYKHCQDNNCKFRYLDSIGTAEV